MKGFPFRCTDDPDTLRIGMTRSHGFFVEFYWDDEGMHRLDVVRHGEPLFPSHTVTDDDWIADQVSRTDGFALLAA